MASSVQYMLYFPAIFGGARGRFGFGSFELGIGCVSGCDFGQGNEFANDKES
jgi:hypothetical protein